jgi:putative ATP-dependent endonuclease of OLD family
VIPAYIRQAIHFAHGRFSRPIIARVLQYRAACLLNADPSAHARVAIFGAQLERFRREEIDLPALKAAFALAMPGDAIDLFLADIA